MAGNYFTSEEIDTNKTDKTTWYNFVRNKEVSILFAELGDKCFESALEIGAGPGIQSIIMSGFCKKLVCTDIDFNKYETEWNNLSVYLKDKTEFMECNAEDLSIFDDNSFDMVYSSNVLVHIGDLKTALNECSRVLKDNGIMIHVIPNRWWKSLNFSLAFFKFKVPSVLGTSKNSFSEFYRLGIPCWIRTFRKHSLTVKKIIPLPFCTGHANSFIPIVKLGNRLNIPTSYAYILNKDVSSFSE